MAETEKLSGKLTGQLGVKSVPSQVLLSENSRSSPSNAPEQETMLSTTPALPPHMAKPPTQVLDEISRTPLFMTSLESTEDATANPDLAALQALAYEGPVWEVAQNFREQGNETFRAKRWKDAREYYTKAVVALTEAARKRKQTSEVKYEVDEGEETIRKENNILILCLVNRAACNLELKNYRQVTLDCAQALTYDPRNAKAYYRLALASFHLSKFPEALNAIESALSLSPNDKAILSLRSKVLDKQAEIMAKARAKQEAEAKQKREKQGVIAALKIREIRSRTNPTDAWKPVLPSAADDAQIKLNKDGTLTFPVHFLYPLTLQSDFVSGINEMDTLAPHLADIFPPPWDGETEYTPDEVECYMDTAAGGLVKVGKNVAIGKVLIGGKVEVVDGVVKVLVVPKRKVGAWLEEFKARKETRYG